MADWRESDGLPRLTPRRTQSPTKTNTAAAEKRPAIWSGAHRPAAAPWPHRRRSCRRNRARAAPRGRATGTAHRSPPTAHRPAARCAPAERHSHRPAEDNGQAGRRTDDVPVHFPASRTGTARPAEPDERPELHHLPRRLSARRRRPQGRAAAEERPARARPGEAPLSNRARCRKESGARAHLAPRAGGSLLTRTGEPDAAPSARWRRHALGFRHTVQPPRPGPE